MSKLSRHHPRPRIQRAFVRWFRENRSRFIVPKQITEVSHGGIGLKFPSHPDCLSVGLSRFDLSVFVDWQEIGWDMLISLDAIPERVLGGEIPNRIPSFGNVKPKYFNGFPFTTEQMSTGLHWMMPCGSSRTTGIGLFRAGAM